MGYVTLKVRLSTSTYENGTEKIVTVPMWGEDWDYTFSGYTATQEYWSLNDAMTDLTGFGYYTMFVKGDGERDALINLYNFNSSNIINLKNFNSPNNRLKIYLSRQNFFDVFVGVGGEINLSYTNSDNVSGTITLRGTASFPSYSKVHSLVFYPSMVMSILNRPFGFMESRTYSNDGLALEFSYPSDYYNELFANFWNGTSPIVEETDPYENGGETTSGGGTGTFSDTGDDIDVPALPTLSAVDTGFITLFNPSLAELKSLAAYMWAGLFDISTFKKIFADPMDCIIGLSIVPVAVPSGTAAEVKVGNIGTGINITTASAQYVELDCGTLNVQEFWGAYLDYDPYTKFEIYLPYIGTHPINADDIMGKTIQVVYHVDILSGACNAYLKCGGTVLYTFIGQCASSIPITGNDWTNVINGVLSIAGAIGTMVATGGTTAPMAAGTIASTAVNGFKSNVEKSGSMSGTGGMLAIQKPYLICTRPRQARPAYQNMYLGYPSFITSLISELSGYTEIEEIHLENIPATANEIIELESILKGGVIL